MWVFFENETLLPGTYSTARWEALTHLQPASTVITPTSTNNLNNGVNYISNFSFKSAVLPTAGGQNHQH